MAALRMSDCDNERPATATRRGSPWEKQSQSREKRAMWRPEQRSLSWMSSSVEKFKRGGKLVTHFSADTCLTAKICILLGHQTNLAGCDLDSDVQGTAWLHLL